MSRGEDTIGSLDLYGYEGSAFDETSRAVAIVLAKGILMATQDLDADSAFALLVRASQAQNVKLRKLAEEVARTQQLPEPTG